MTRAAFQAAACLAILFVLSACAAANTYYWSVSPPSTGDWSIAANWGGAAPTSNDDAWITNSGSATITNVGEVCRDIYLGDDQAGWLQMTSGSLTVSANEYVAYSGLGILSQSGGENYEYGGGLFVGYNPASSGTYALSGSGFRSRSRSDRV